MCFFRFDGRPAADKHWSADPPAGFGARAMFITETDPAMLVITSVMVGDAGLFRCRVDFKANQTQNSYVQVSVIGRNRFYVTLSVVQWFTHPTHFSPISGV